MRYWEENHISFPRSDTSRIIFSSFFLSVTDSVTNIRASLFILVFVKGLEPLQELLERRSGVALFGFA